MTNNDLNNDPFMDSKSIGSTLHTARKAKQISQEKAAENADLSVSTIKNIEKGDSCSLKSVARYATSLGLDPSEVIFKSAYQPRVSTMESQVNKLLCSLSEQQRHTLLTIIRGILNFSSQSE